MKTKLITTILILFLFGFVYSTEMPKPTYDNQFVFSITHSFLYEDAAEINYIKSQFGDGIYAPLAFSGFFGVEMGWNINPSNAGSGIRDFKDKVDQLVDFAKTYNVGIHLTLVYGLSRNVTFYDDAKIADVRNAEWFNDNNLMGDAEADQMAEVAAYVKNGFIYYPYNHVELGQSPLMKYEHSNRQASSSVITDEVYSTLSRYARKLRSHLEAKVEEAFDYLVRVQNANPDILIIVSGPGETEHNRFRLINNQYIQDFYADFSPFSILEFRDWIKHEGLYATGQKYAGDGYVDGGSRYQGSSGLSNFNADFGTSFSSWDLKYFNWSLTDAVDTNYTDSTDPDPHAIPVAQYTENGMMPSSGGNYIAGGFDAPREMKTLGTDAFYDLFNSFREYQVFHFVKDMTKIARLSGFNKDHYYTHQIPADYLFGTRPNDPTINLNPRYHSSSSPLWTADAYSDMGLGITLYDLKVDSTFHRTTKYAIDACNNLSDNWAALEYNSEVTTSSNVSSVSTIYDQMVLLYEGDPHMVSLFKWEGGNYQFKGTNRETAAKQFFDNIKNIAREALGTMLTPKIIVDLTASFSSADVNADASAESAGTVNLRWSSKIWTDLDYEWPDWGDFKEFVIYRGYSSDFTADGSSEIGRTTSYSYDDTGFTAGSTVFYKIGAVNDNNVVGTLLDVSVSTSGTATTPVISLSKSSMSFQYAIGGSNPANQTFNVSNTGVGTLNWTVSDNVGWMSCSPTSGRDSGTVTVSVTPGSLAVGSHSGTITVSDSNASPSSQTINVSVTVTDPTQGDPVLSVSREQLNYCYLVGGNIPGAQTIRISNTGSGQLNWTLTENVAWLTPSATSGTGDAFVDLTVSPSALAAGSYSTLVTIADPNADGSPINISVNLTVKNASQDQVPFGFFETPEDNANVASSIPVSGWVLDDVGVETLKIYRDPVAGEPNGLVFIGNAVFVEGARPDVEADYPDYPLNYRAGWGYMLLTNFLPNGGNGTYKLYAIATDTSGNQVTLGTKTIHSNNNDAVKPFGALDTPPQGGVASGNSFINWGWALTPMPNNIPTDGSSLSVYLDGVKLGNPKYNIYRQDIATLFPGYANTNGAVGYLIIDTTTYADGVHNIYWYAKDSSGNKDGIGSRFFSISNIGNDSRSARQGIHSTTSTENLINKQPYFPKDKINKIPVASQSVIGVKHVSAVDDNLKPVKSGKNGLITVAIEQNQLVELHLADFATARIKKTASSKGFLAFQSVGAKHRALPIGSTFDSRNGVFYWAPGPGFLGDFYFDFIIIDGTQNKKITRKRVKITIDPKSY